MAQIKTPFTRFRCFLPRFLPPEKPALPTLPSPHRLLRRLLPPHGSAGGKGWAGLESARSRAPHFQRNGSFFPGGFSAGSLSVRAQRRQGHAWHPARPGLRHPPPPRRTSTRSVKPTVRALNLWARSSLTWRRAGWLCGTAAAPVAAAQPAWDAGSRKTRSAAGVLLSSSAALLRIAPQR